MGLQNHFDRGLVELGAFSGQLCLPKFDADHHRRHQGRIDKWLNLLQPVALVDGGDGLHHSVGLCLYFARVELFAPIAHQHPYLFFVQGLYIQTHKIVAKDSILPVASFAGGDDKLIFRIDVVGEHFHLCPHLSPFRLVHNLIQTVQQEQAAAPQQQPVEEIFREFQGRAALFQIPGNEAGQGVGAGVIQLAPWDIAARLLVLAVVAQGNQQRNGGIAARREAERQGSAGLGVAGQTEGQVGQQGTLAAARAADDGQPVVGSQQVCHFHRFAALFALIRQGKKGFALGQRVVRPELLGQLFHSLARGRRKTA